MQLNCESDEQKQDKKPFASLRLSVKISKLRNVSGKFYSGPFSSVLHHFSKFFRFFLREKVLFDCMVN